MDGMKIKITRRRPRLKKKTHEMLSRVTLLARLENNFLHNRGCRTRLANDPQTIRLGFTDWFILKQTEDEPTNQQAEVNNNNNRETRAINRICRSGVAEVLQHLNSNFVPRLSDWMVHRKPGTVHPNPIRFFYSSG